MSMSTGAGVAGKFAFQIVEHRVLEDQHRIRIRERRRKHPARVFERCRREDLDPGDVRVPAFEAVRMLRGELAPAAGRHANHERVR